MHSNILHLRTHGQHKLVSPCLIVRRMTLPSSTQLQQVRDQSSQQRTQQDHHHQHHHHKNTHYVNRSHYKNSTSSNSNNNNNNNNNKNNSSSPPVNFAATWSNPNKAAILAKHAATNQNTHSSSNDSNYPNQWNQRQQRSSPVFQSRRNEQQSPQSIYKSHPYSPISLVEVIPEELKAFDYENFSWPTVVDSPIPSISTFRKMQQELNESAAEEAHKRRLDERKVKRLLDRMASRFHFKRNCPVMNFELTWFSFSNYLLSGNFPLLFDTILTFFERNTDGISITSLSYEQTDELEHFVAGFFNSYCRKIHPDDFDLYQQGLQFCNFTNPQLYYLRKKKLKREIIYHAGPTNSGKTHQALLELCQANAGVYLAPLRLLAQEVCHRLNTQFNTKCSLLTGQERKEVIGAKHISCTVEMLNHDQVYNVAVIDEIQMIKDPQRGQAWTKALLGLQAQRIHLCGDHTAFELVKRILMNNGDETVELKEYSRMTDLQLWPEGSLKGDVHQIQKRDCIIVFSRKDIFHVKSFIEVQTGLKCAVIYGGLPPESRKEQAELFNDETSGYDVLIATDAVGMGLNLNIKRIVFFKTKKVTVDRNTSKVKPVEYMLMKQIAGRAGRRGFYDVGYVTTFLEQDFEYLKQSLHHELQPIESAGIFPNLDQLQAFSTKFPEYGADMASILEKYTLLSKGHKDFFLCDSDKRLQIARKIRHIGLTLEQQCIFMDAPIPPMEEAQEYLIRYAEDFANPRIYIVPLHIDAMKLLKNLQEARKEMEDKTSQNLIRGTKAGVSSVLDISPTYSSANYGYQDALRKVESAMKVLDTYRWLAHRFPVRFDQELVESTQDAIIEQIGRTLLHHTRQNQKHRTLAELTNVSIGGNSTTTTATRDATSNETQEDEDIFSSLLDEISNKI